MWLNALNRNHSGLLGCCCWGSDSPSASLPPASSPWLVLAESFPPFFLLPWPASSSNPIIPYCAISCSIKCSVVISSFLKSFFLLRFMLAGAVSNESGSLGLSGRDRPPLCDRPALELPGLRPIKGPQIWRVKAGLIVGAQIVTIPMLTSILWIVVLEAIVDSYSRGR